MLRFPLAAMFAIGSACAPATVAGHSPLPAEFQTLLDSWARQQGHYGVSGSVILRDGTQWTGSAGRAGDQPLESDGLIAIASITKTMTGAIILRLAEEERLSLDEAIGRWLPNQPHVNPAITVRQLLNHTSGVANYTANPALSAAIAADFSHRFTIDELLEFVVAPSFDPGARTQYTNTAFLLLGRIAELVTGQPIAELYQTMLWDPLDIHEIFLPGATAAPGPVPPVLTNGVVVRPLDRMSLLTAANAAFGLMATARTVARWGRALFAGSVLSPATQAAMRTLVPAAGNIPGESGAGLGIRSYQYLGRTQYGHSGGSSVGSSLLLYDPESGVTVAVVKNQGQGADHFQLAPRLLELAAGR